MLTTNLEASDILKNLLGIPATRGELAPEKRGELDLGDVVVEKWMFTAEPGSKIPLTLYRPRRVIGRIPAVVLTCGHGGSKSVVHMTYVARTHARAGVACLLADPLGEEERHCHGGMGTRAHDAAEVACRAEMAGRSVMGKFVFDTMRALDFMETLDWVDDSRLGVTGNSLGGAVAGWLFALEPRLRMTIVSGWAFSDILRKTSKHCTRIPNRKLRAICEWPEFLALGAGHSALLVMNGNADVIIDPDASGTVWRDTQAYLAALDPGSARLRTWFQPGGGHRPYHGTKQALRFVNEWLGTPDMTADQIAAMPELIYGQWCDQHDVEIEPLYGSELHYRGALLPDLGLAPIPRDRLAVLTQDEIGSDDFTIAGWLKAVETAL